ncbi:hypothetical protein J2S46_008079 [Kitasatospora herbaricolor]|nr:hypothetical protein [Kitasatospora herbaricolor]
MLAVPDRARTWAATASKQVPCPLAAAGGGQGVQVGQAVLRAALKESASGQRHW